jgi:hypothetical protein
MKGRYGSHGRQFHGNLLCYLDELDAASELMNLDFVISVSPTWRARIATSTALVSQPLDLVRLADVELPAQLLLFCADTPSALVHRAYAAGHGARGRVHRGA